MMTSCRARNGPADKGTRRAKSMPEPGRLLKQIRFQWRLRRVGVRIDFKDTSIILYRP